MTTGPVAAQSSLFGGFDPEPCRAARHRIGPSSGRAAPPLRRYVPRIEERALALLEQADNPTDPQELLALYLGRVECEARTGDPDDTHARLWRRSVRRRRCDAQEFLSSRAVVRFVKELFNHYFRDDLYGRFQSDRNLILSSGAVCEESFGLPDVLKATVRFPLHRDLYGYSDSRGRIPARDALASLESARLPGADYSREHVAVTLGATSAISALADMLLSVPDRAPAPALCGIPNYPPLIESIAKRHPVRQVPLPADDGVMAVEPLIEALTPDTPLVLLQTVANPTGAHVDEASLDRLVAAASPRTVILLDECHDFLGNAPAKSPRRAASNVVRIMSMSKIWSVPGMKVGWIVADPALIGEFYEYASTGYGGPPSFFSTLLEVYARFEDCLERGFETPGDAALGWFDDSYRIDRDTLARALAAYRLARTERESGLLRARESFGTAMGRAGFNVFPPELSINTTIRSDRWPDSYVAFRDILAEHGVSFYPDVLNFGYDAGALRMTTSRSARDLDRLVDRFEPAPAL